MKILWSLFVLLTCAQVHAQQSANGYLNNIVNLGASRYGLIVGEGGGKLFAITAAAAGEGDLSNARLTAHFHKQPGEAVVSGIRSFRIGESRIHLLEIAAPARLRWAAHGYDRFDVSESAVYRSFIPDKRRDERWYENATPFSPNAAADGGDEVMLKTTYGNTYTQGMPVVDAAGFLVGIVADRQDDRGTSTVMRVVKMTAIADRLHAAAQCKYFQLVEAGYNLNRCERDRQATDLRARELKQAKQDGKIQVVAFGPAVFGGLNAFAGSGVDTSAISVNWAPGFNIYLRPDQGRVTLTLMPRVYFSHFRLASNQFPAYPYSGFRVQRYAWETIEVPVMVDILFRRDVWYNTYFSIGYAPGYQSDVRYKYVTDNSPVARKVTAQGTGGYSQKVLVGLGIEGRRVRIDLIAGQQVSPWNRSTPRIIGIEYVDPFAYSGSRYFFIGLHIGTRINGRWGLKSVN